MSAQQVFAVIRAPDTVTCWNTFVSICIVVKLTLNKNIKCLSSALSFGFFVCPITLTVVKLNREPRDSKINIKNLS